MKKLFAFFLLIVYSAFIGGTLWAVPSSPPYEFATALEHGTNGISDSEPSKNIEAPHFTKIFKNLPGKIKLPRFQSPFFSVKFFSEKDLIHPGKLLLAFRNFTTHSTPLFIINRVFRI